MRKHNRKYRQIIETAKDLFWRYGIKRVTIEEICRVSTVSKMTFYKHFKNKNELIKKIMMSVGNAGLDKYQELLTNDMVYSEKVKKMILLKIEQTNKISQEFINDYYSLNDPELNEFLQDKIKVVLEDTLKDIIKAQEKGEVRRDIKPEFIMYFLNHMTEMATDPKLTPLFENGQDLIMEMLNFFFYGILPRSQTENNG